MIILLLNLFINKSLFVFAEINKVPTIEKIKPNPAISKIVEMNIKLNSINKDFF